MPALYNLQLTAVELNLVISNLTEAAHRWRLIVEDNPHLPETVSYARTEWLQLIAILEKIDPPVGI